MTDRLFPLQAFVRVVEEGSFSGAARRLGSSTSAISRQVAQLEAGLGVRLLQRTTRSLTLTEAGQGYYQRVSQALSDLDDADRAVRQLQASPRGVLRINAPVSFGVRHLVPALGAFREVAPEITLDLTLNDHFVDLIDEGVDVAVRIGRLPESDLVARRLAPVRRMVCGSPAYLAAHGTPATPDDLTGHACLSYANVSMTEEWRFVRSDGTSWPLTLSGPLRANNGDALLEAALAGLGLAVLPTFIAGPAVQAGRVVEVLPGFLPDHGAVHAVYPTPRHLSPKVRCFVDFLVERFSPVPPWDRGG
ncbi:LysR family transcriptional regulator [Pararhodospirillum photometricum]|uniref:Transcriptional regulator, LysR family protein n=1 Tax=Pararhodospirillum photometricum DSM 122 TaxID=1150469 RepID=H6SQQ8_PARPM|nr:LysR family transcriptional regulator [Pararhodospirillum photometricum]CCG07373.1 Transcriptional regulator, LysR family protein [Pararhodospirillum photometricum DSM 122]